MPARREDDAADHHQHEADQALEAHRDAQADRAGAGAAAAGGGLSRALRRQSSCRRPAFGSRPRAPCARRRRRRIPRRCGPARSTTMRSQRPISSGISLEATRMPRPLRRELAQPRVDLALGADVDAARRLVEQQQPRLAEHFLGEHDLLLVAAGQRADGDVGIAAAGCRTGRRIACDRLASRARDIRPERRDAPQHRHARDCARPPSRSIRPLPRRSSVTKASPARRAARIEVEPGRPAVDLDDRPPSAGAGRCRRARRAARSAPRP